MAASVSDYTIYNNLDNLQTFKKIFLEEKTDPKWIV